MALADGVAIETGAVVGYPHQYFSALAADVDRDGTFHRLADGDALGGILDAVRERVAQHVLERRLHALHHAAIHFTLCAFHAQLRALAEFVGGPAQRAAQVRHHRLERHHARTHQAVLQIGVDTRLLQQQRFGLARLIVQDVLDRGQVRHRFRERARILLQVGEAVEFQRIERRAFAGFVLALVARQDLGFGFDLEFSQLFAQARDGLVEFDQVEAEVADLLFQARAVDRRFARRIHQRIEQIRTHPD